MKKKNKKDTKKKSKLKIIILVIIILIPLLGVGGYFYYDRVLLDKLAPIKIKLNGDKKITLEFESEYEELGATAKFRDKDISKSIEVINRINYKKLGTYKVYYIASTDKKSKKIYREVQIVDTVKPTISLKGNKEVKVNLGDEYKEPGYTASDNYDGDITKNVIVLNNIDKDKLGTYEVVYRVKDTSGNDFEIKRYVKVIEPYKALPSLDATASRIAVLNYHFFYDPTKNEKGGDSNFISVQNFEEQLQYLKENNYKTLTMDEFRRWMYGEINLPARSVLITIDDGGTGTSFINGNKLIPLLEKYQAHATLFLISGWWSKSNYSSSYLDIESHSHEMHFEGYCQGVSRGAKMLCLSDEEVLADLQASINAVGSSKAFCYPFYAYNQHSMELVQQAGFKLGFVGGDYKASRSSNKFAIPRYHVYKNTTLIKFNNMIA